MRSDVDVLERGLIGGELINQNVVFDDCLGMIGELRHRDHPGERVPGRLQRAAAVAGESHRVDEVEDDDFTEFDGDLHDYEKWLNQQSSTELAKLDTSGQGKAKLDKKEQRQLAAVKRQHQAPLRKQVKALEREIDKLHTQLNSIDESLADETIYAADQKTELADLLRRQGKLKTELDKKEEQWLMLQEELAP